MGVKISGLTETTSSNDVDYMVITRTDQNYKIKVKVLRDEAKRYTDNAISSLASRTYVDAKYDELVALINSSKEVIANAITEMGVETDATASFEVMAENIKKIGK